MLCAELDTSAWTPAETDANLRALDEDLADLQAELDAALKLAAADEAKPSAVGAPPEEYEAKLRASIEAELREKVGPLNFVFNLPLPLHCSGVEKYVYRS